MVISEGLGNDMSFKIQIKLEVLEASWGVLARLGRFGRLVRFQVALWRTQAPLGGIQENPKRLPRDPKRTQESPKTAQDGPKTAQDGPETAQDDPRNGVPKKY